MEQTDEDKNHHVKIQLDQLNRLEDFRELTWEESLLRLKLQTETLRLDCLVGMDRLISTAVETPQQAAPTPKPILVDLTLTVKPLLVIDLTSEASYAPYGHNGHFCHCRRKNGFSRKAKQQHTEKTGYEYYACSNKSKCNYDTRCIGDNKLNGNK